MNIFQNEFDGDNNDLNDIDVKHHFCYIKNLSRVVSTQLSKNFHKRFICDRCLNYFLNESTIAFYTVLCMKENEFKMKFSKELHVKLKKIVFKEKVPFVI